jgi:septum site-determining protein MinD
LKTKIVAERLGSKPIGIIINFVYGEKGEVSAEEIMKMLELPSYGSIPYDDEVRKSFMMETVKPVILHAPSAPASIAMRKIAAKIAGIAFDEKAAVAAKPAAKGTNLVAKLINSILSIFKKKK